MRILFPIAFANRIACRHTKLLKSDAAAICKKNLKVSRRARITVLLWKQRFICQCRLTATALPGFAPNRSLRAAATSLQIDRVSKVPFSAASLRRRCAVSRGAPSASSQDGWLFDNLITRHDWTRYRREGKAIMGSLRETHVAFQLDKGHRSLCAHTSFRAQTRLHDI
jgi:hypothetical protein